MVRNEISLGLSSCPVESRRRILVVDEDDFVRNLLVRTLTEQGYQVVECADVAEVMGLELGPNRPVDLVIMDLLLQSGNPHKLSRDLTRRLPWARFLYTSGFYRRVVNRCEVDPGEFLAKPFGPEELLRKVRSRLQDSPAA